MLYSSSKVLYIGSFLILALSLTGADHHCPKDCECFSTVVDCSGIGFMEVPTDGIIPKATKWVLSHNNIMHLGPESLQLATRLEKNFSIDLSSNLIWEIEDNTFSSLDNLIVLNLTYNYITSISHLALKAENLRVLDLSKNEDLELPELGFETPSIQVLRLVDCMLKSIPQQFFKGMEKIEIIDLSHNLLTTLYPNLFHTTKHLQNLDLSFNLLSDLLWIPIHHLPENANVQLDSNNISCACVSGHSLEILTRSKGKCYLKNTEFDLSMFLTRNCSALLTLTSTAPTTIVNLVTSSSRPTEHSTTPTMTRTGTLLASSTAATSSSTNTSLLNVKNIEGDDVRGNKTPVDQEHRNTMGYNGRDWVFGGIGALGLVAVAVFVLIAVRRRNVWLSDSQRFIFLKTH